MEPVDRFKRALARLESDGDLAPMAGLLAEDGEFGAAVGPQEARGRKAWHDYWRMYRDTFREVASTFTAVIAADGRAALEWRTRGVDRFGSPIDYGGVTVLEWRGDELTRFRAYFDPGVIAAERQEAGRPVIFHREGEDIVRETP